MRLTCGPCLYYQPNRTDLTQGDCHCALPQVAPVALPGKGPVTMTMRPSVGAQDVACAQHKPRLVEAT